MTSRILLLLLILLLSPAAVDASSSNEEWIITQDSPLFGDHSFYVSASAVRLKNRVEDLEAVSKAPDWKVYSFRRKERMMWITDKFDWKQLMGQLGKVGDPGKFVKSGKGKSAGLQCTRYVESLGPAYTLTADDIKVDPKVGDFISDFYRIPHFHSVPLANFGWKGRTEKYPVKDWLKYDSMMVSATANYKFATKSCKKVRFNPADFEVPSGFKLCSSGQELMLSPGKREELESVIEDLGFASSTETKQESKRPPK